MTTQSKTVMSWVCFMIGVVVFSVIFNTAGIYLGLKVREEGGSPAPMIANVIALGLFLLRLIWGF